MSKMKKKILLFPKPSILLDLKEGSISIENNNSPIKFSCKPK